ncbi:MAG: hypothetical protein JXR48_12210 [Candidatus Delongbacteria bacterium]|nr:hypothetical protein [Candidatus Delongbacteria bacterium]MBN2835716.1 hypothetical protein [Candidatus Delongbacteria bacterium]
MKINELKINPVVTRRLPQEILKEQAEIVSKKTSSEDTLIKSELSSEELLIKKTDIVLEKIKGAENKKLEDIKLKLQNGFYNSEEVLSKIADNIIDDQLSLLES